MDRGTFGLEKRRKCEPTVQEIEIGTSGDLGCSAVEKMGAIVKNV